MAKSKTKQTEINSEIEEAEINAEISQEEQPKKSILSSKLPKKAHKTQKQKNHELVAKIKSGEYVINQD